MRVVAVDDDRQFLDIIKLSLPLSPEQLHCFSDPKIALEFLDKNKLQFDYIFLDLYMPQIDGISFINELTKLEFKYRLPNHIPVVLITGSNEEIKNPEKYNIIDIIHKGEDTIKKLKGIISTNGRLEDVNGVRTA